MVFGVAFPLEGCVECKDDFSATWGSKVSLESEGRSSGIAVVVIVETARRNSCSKEEDEDGQTDVTFYHLSRRNVNETESGKVEE